MGFNLIDVSNKIYTARHKHKIKQTEICRKLNMSQPSYSKLESGKVDIPISVLYRLSVILDVSVAWLLDDEAIDDFSEEERLEIEKFKKYLKLSRRR